MGTKKTDRRVVVALGRRRSSAAGPHRDRRLKRLTKKKIIQQEDQ